MYQLVQLEAAPLNIELSEPFGIARGAQQCALNVLVTVLVRDVRKDRAEWGYGEAAPFAAVNGETQAQALHALELLKARLPGEKFARVKELCQRAQMHWALPPTEQRAAAPNRQGLSSASAECALEMALLDATCKLEKRSMLEYFGAAQNTLTTDVTITTGSIEHARKSAANYSSLGFRTLKIKVGGIPVADDAARLLAISRAAPNCQLVLDANASYTPDEAVKLIELIAELRRKVILFEQPTPAENLAALKQVRRELARSKALGVIPIAADESARSAADIDRLFAAEAVDVVNIKIMKSGIFEALEMVRNAKRHGLRLMIGGMVESPLAMTVSACMAAGQGGFSYIDLDTPLFMNNIPLRGGFEQNGPTLSLARPVLGHGVTPLDVRQLKR